MAKDGYGVFVHWNLGSAVGPGATNVLVWNDRVTGFDVVDFADAVEASGAKWVISTIIHVDNYVPFPLPLWDSLLPGKIASRDLLDDLHAELESCGIAL